MQQFYIGKRPKLALMTGPQHDKSLAATDFAAWVAASYSLPFSIYECINQQLELRRHPVRYSLEPEIAECAKKTDRIKSHRCSRGRTRSS